MSAAEMYGWIESDGNEHPGQSSTKKARRGSLSIERISAALEEQVLAMREGLAAERVENAAMALRLLELREQIAATERLVAQIEVPLNGLGSGRPQLRLCR